MLYLFNAKWWVEVETAHLMWQLSSPVPTSRLVVASEFTGILRGKSKLNAPAPFVAIDSYEKAELSPSHQHIYRGFQMKAGNACCFPLGHGRGHGNDTWPRRPSSLLPNAATTPVNVATTRTDFATVRLSQCNWIKANHLCHYSVVCTHMQSLLAGCMYQELRKLSLEHPPPYGSDVADLTCTADCLSGRQILESRIVYIQCQYDSRWMSAVSRA